MNPEIGRALVAAGASMLFIRALLGEPLPPGQAAGRMLLPSGLRVELAASEPEIVQPVAIEFDPHGRLWVIQYLQYPNPAGLRRSRVDRWSRTIYDRVPEPPPRGPKGADRISILTDTNHDGHFESTHDFVKDLNLATGIAFGHGGVFVLNVPYLLFYPDRNGDDIPDSDPEVCLEGFGMEDAHSVANSLTWGPDGWLYGCQGSTVTARIRGVEFQQGVWRYHPLSRRFELFCEGGGNSWGIDFDEDGELLYSTNVGPYRNMHGVQGGYSWKAFGKHGGLHLPHAYGFFEHVPHTNFTGGHVTVGGILYRGTNLPPEFVGSYIAGDLLGHSVQWHRMFPRGSSFTSAHGGLLLNSRDAWFAPTDVTMAPDGAVFVADWHDARTAHPDPDAEWDRTNGRIFRIARATPAPIAIPKFNSIPTEALVQLLTNPNPWWVRQVRREFAERRDPRAIEPLRELLLTAQDDAADLEALWALNASGGFDEAWSIHGLAHRTASIRKWSVRLLGDPSRRLGSVSAAALQKLAETEHDVRVRSQIAASARRLPADQSLPLLETLLLRDLDAGDPHVPLLIWWALERHAIESLPRLEAFAKSRKAWQSSLFREAIAGRLMRRWAAEGSTATLEACASCLAHVDAREGRQAAVLLIEGLDLGLSEKEPHPTGLGPGGLFASSAEIEAKEPRPTVDPMPDATRLRTELQRQWSSGHREEPLLRVTARLGLPAGLAEVRSIAFDKQSGTPLRERMIRLLGSLGKALDAERLLNLLDDAPPTIQLAALDAWSAIGDSASANALRQRYPRLGGTLRAKTRDVLLGRREWARAFLLEIDSGGLPPSEIPPESLRPVAAFGDAEMNAIVRRHWGRIGRGTPEQRLAEMRRYNNELNAGTGDRVAGRQIFDRLCSVCHALFGRGGRVGPDLAHANRNDREFLLASLVDPSAVIRKEYVVSEIELTDGRFWTGVTSETQDGQLRIRTASGEESFWPRSRIAARRESDVSLMPENLLTSLQSSEVRDLFAYLQGSGDADPADRE